MINHIAGAILFIAIMASAYALDQRIANSSQQTQAQR